MDRLIVFVNNERAGVLERTEINRFVFTYDPDATLTVSLTMPIRRESYVSPYLHPVFQTSLPQGRLRQIIENDLGKRMSTAGDMQVLSVVGGNLIGAIKCLPENVSCDDDLQQAMQESFLDVMTSKANNQFIDAFVSKHAPSSGVSGGFTKALVKMVGDGGSHSLITSKNIVKFEDDDHPSISAVEYFSMEVARRCGIQTSNVYLSSDGKMLAVERFDIGSNECDERSCAFEDMCAVVGLPSDHKFMSSVENIVRSIKNYCSKSETADSLRRFFIQYAASSILRNGDAHLKNFGLLTTPSGVTALSPAYDMVSMSVYAPTENGRALDHMALMFNGTKRWLQSKEMTMLGARCGVSSPDVAMIIDRIHAAISDVSLEVASYIESHEEHKDVLQLMLHRWGEGLGDFGLSLPEEVAPECSDVKKGMRPK